MMDYAFNLTNRLHAMERRFTPFLSLTKLLLRLLRIGEILNFIYRDFAVDLGSSLCLFDHKTESIFGHAAVVIESLGHAVIGGGGHLLIDLQPVGYDLDSPGAILRDIAIGFDSRLDDPLNFFRLLFDFFRWSPSHSQGN